MKSLLFADITDTAQAVSGVSEVLLAVLGIFIAVMPILIFVRLGELITEAKRANAYLANLDRNAVTAINRSVTTEVEEPVEA